MMQAATSGKAWTAPSTEGRGVRNQRGRPNSAPSRWFEEESEMGYGTAARGLFVLALCELASGCASVAPVAYSGVASSAYLAPNPSDSSGRVPYRYAATADWRTYDKVMLDPIVVYRGRDHQFGDMSEHDKAALAAYMRTRF